MQPPDGSMPSRWYCGAQHRIPNFNGTWLQVRPHIASRAMFQGNQNEVLFHKAKLHWVPLGRVQQNKSSLLFFFFCHLPMHGPNLMMLND